MLPEHSFQQGVRSPHVLGCHLDRVDGGADDGVADSDQKSGDHKVPHGAGHAGEQPAESVGNTTDH